MQITQPVQILAVEGRQVNTKRGPGTIFDVKASDGNEYSTFDGPTAQKASSHVGAGPVTLGYETKVNGQYTNLILKEVIADGVEAAVGATGVSVRVVEPMNVSGFIPIAPPVNQGEKDRKITRLAAQKTAFAFASQLVRDDLDTAALFARKLTEELVRHAHTGLWPDETEKEAEAGISW